MLFKPGEFENIGFYKSKFYFWVVKHFTKEQNFEVLMDFETSLVVFPVQHEYNLIVIQNVETKDC